MIRSISATEAKARIEAGPEAALLDIREAGQFGEGHPLLAVPCPYSTLELQILRLVPRLDAPLLLFDDGDSDGVTEKAARRLEGLGYDDIALVEGGIAEWREAGFTLFKGVNVPSKTLGELAEGLWHPETISARDLRQWKDSGRPFRFFDARPPAEYGKMRVPGAACLPNGELLYRLDAATGDADVPVVVTCAGRTRGIIGTIGLRLFGIRNPVFALENGTQGWALAGEVLERHNEAGRFPALSPEDKRAGEERARAFAAHWSIPVIDRSGLAALRRERERTLYLLDVRSAEEFAAGHCPGAVHAPSGQIVQATDQWIGVRRARVVLADDNGMRASLAAFWLKQLGYEVYVLPGCDDLENAETGHAADRLPPSVPRLKTVDAAQARRRTQAGAHLLDLRSSHAHRAGAPKEAIWTIRPRLANTLGAGTDDVILLTDRPGISNMAAIDLREHGARRVDQMDGRIDALAAAGFEIVRQDVPGRTDAIDFLDFVHDRHDGNLESSRRYLAWEQGLVAQLDAGERATFLLSSVDN